MTLTVPHDPWAEQTVVGCAIATNRGYQLAITRITVEDLYQPSNRRLFAVCGELDDCGDGATLESEQARISHAGQLAAIPHTQVVELVANRGCLHDTAGSFARRVLEAAQRRRLMGAACDLYNRLGEGARIDELDQILNLIFTYSQPGRAA